MGKWRVVDNNFDLHIENTYAIEDKHETNIYDIYELCKRLNDLEAICSHQKEVIALWKEECKKTEKPKFFYQVSKYQEHGFASSTTTIGTYLSKEKAKEVCKQLQKEDSNSWYDVHERKFDD